MKYKIETLEELLKQDGDAGCYTKTYRLPRWWFFEKKYTYTERELSKSEIENLVRAWPIDPKRECFWKLLKKTDATDYVTEGGYPTIKFREEVLENVIKIIHDPSSKEHKDSLVNLGKKLPVYFDYQAPLLFVGGSLLILMMVILPVTLIPSADGVFPFAMGITISVISSVASLLLLTASYLADRTDCRFYQNRIENSQTINFGLFKPTLSQTEIETNSVSEKSDARESSQVTLN